jgi:ABC-type transport system substrate-binding protein
MTVLSRRSLLASAAAATIAGTAGRSAEAQSTAAPLRIAMSLSDIPRMWGGPDAGFEGLRFGGYFVFDALINWDMSKADQPSRLVPGLATSWSVDPADRRRWLFTLREGVTFHDGTPFDADAVIWNLDSVFNQQSPQYHAPRVGLIRSRLSSLGSYEKIDARTIAISTNTVDGMFAYQMSFLLMVSPARWRELAGDWQRFAMQPAGTGPYRVVAISARERCELAAFDAYWDKARIPKVVRTILVPMGDASARVAALRSGQVDIVESVPPDTIASLKAAGMQVLTNSYPHIWAWRLNVQPGSPFHDLRIRQAANLAIDRKGMVELLAGSALPAAGKVAPGDPWFGNPKFAIGYDPDRARGLMREAGFGPSRPITVKVIIASGGGGQMLPLPMNEFIQENLKAIGINVEFQVVDFGTIIGMMRAGSKDPAQMGAHAINIAIPSIEPTTGWIIYDSALVNPRGVNWGYYNSPAVDAQLQVVRQQFDVARQDAEMAKLHEILVDEAAALFVVHDLNPRALAPRIGGFVQSRNWFQDYTSVTIRSS